MNTNSNEILWYPIETVCFVCTYPRYNPIDPENITFDVMFKITRIVKLLYLFVIGICSVLAWQYKQRDDHEWTLIVGCGMIPLIRLVFLNYYTYITIPRKINKHACTTTNEPITHQPHFRNLIVKSQVWLRVTFRTPKLSKIDHPTKTAPPRQPHQDNTTKTAPPRHWLLFRQSNKVLF